MSNSTAARTREQLIAWTAAISANNAAVSLTSRGCFEDAKRLSIKAAQTFRFMCDQQLAGSSQFFEELRRIREQIAQLSSQQELPTPPVNIKVVHSSIGCPVALWCQQYLSCQELWTMIQIEELPFSESVDELEAYAGFVLYNAAIANFLASHAGLSGPSLMIPVKLLKAALSILTVQAQHSLDCGIPDLFSYVSMLSLQKMVILYQYLGLQDAASEAMASFCAVRDHFMCHTLPHECIAAPVA